MTAQRKPIELTSNATPAAATPGSPRPQLRPVPATAAGTRVANPRKRWITPVRVYAVLVLALLAWGLRFPTEQYITPQTGWGYALGIIGGSLMLLLLIYPARKRKPGLRAIGSTKLWFQIHMALGILGPVLILFHSNFRLGATNSNVALFCMLVVAGSGLFGRYFYANIHHGLHGRKATLAELREYAERLRHVSTEVAFLPELVNRIGFEEQQIIARCARRFVLIRPVVGAANAFMARRHLRHYVERELQIEVGKGATPRAQAQRLADVASSYIDSRLAATRRVVEFTSFEQLFSLWHALHMPLFVMLIIAGIVHVIAVHIY
jgi:hypothetical protein